MAEISSLPWIADPDDRPGMEWNIHIVQAASPDNRVCFMSNGPASEANADFIVKACNAHDQLVKALEFIRDGYARNDIGHVDFRVCAYKAALDALEHVEALALTSHKDTTP